MPTWKGIVGSPFTAQAFRRHVAGLRFTAWRPRFVVVHNTWSPRFEQWHEKPGDAWMRGFEHYYRDRKGWSAGPHLFIADDFIWVFTALTTSGVHSPSWNAFSWGVEVVGDYDTEPLPPAVEANTIDALATLHEAIGLDPDSMRRHGSDPLTTHTGCPGVNLDLDRLRSAVNLELARRQIGEHTVESLPPDICDVVVSGRRIRNRRATPRRGK